jgi:FAD/FMN-containing dehydrogenase
MRPHRAALPLFALIWLACSVTPPRTKASTAPPSGHCRPDLPCWPTAQEWESLRSSLSGSLVEARSPLLACTVDPRSADCKAALERAKNPFYLQDQPGGTQSIGWLDAWTAQSSAYAVAARTTSDVVAGVRFAREHHMRLVVKGTGHDYLGRSNAADSLLVWTHGMRTVTVDDAFVPRGCAPSTPPLPAVTVEAGVRWLEAYDEVTTKHHRYVQGGGCTSVGAAGGFLQGGGFGSWSKKYGIAAASMLEAEVVTASGETIVANSCQHQDLLWALKGGGGGTFGIVTRATLMTHPLPSTFGWVAGTVKARSAAAFLDLIGHFLALYDSSLSGESWGEQVRIRRDDTLDVSMAFEGMSADEAKKVWEPFRQWAAQHPESVTANLHFSDMPAEKVWDPGMHDDVQRDDRPDQKSSPSWWWGGDGDQVGATWYAYQSRWIPLERLQADGGRPFAKVLFDASRQWTVGLHFNKGQAGAAPEARRRDQDTSMNPAVLDAAALAIVAAAAGLGRAADPVEGAEQREHVRAAMATLRAATPGAGSYVNETDYFEPDWQESFWGPNYARLLTIKRTYDPDGMFSCHHCVGSEAQ